MVQGAGTGPHPLADSLNGSPAGMVQGAGTGPLPLADRLNGSPAGMVQGAHHGACSPQFQETGTEQMRVLSGSWTGMATGGAGVAGMSSVPSLMWGGTGSSCSASAPRLLLWTDAGEDGKIKTGQHTGIGCRTGHCPPLSAATGSQHGTGHQ
jgi:hypothetical protein